MLNASQDQALETENETDRLCFLSPTAKPETADMVKITKEVAKNGFCSNHLNCWDGHVLSGQCSFNPLPAAAQRLIPPGLCTVPPKALEDAIAALEPVRQGWMNPWSGEDGA